LFRERYGLEFLGEAFNLANHPNVTTVNAQPISSTTCSKTGSKTIGEGNTLDSVFHAVRAGHQHQ
jgi:hypothetical protein